MVRSKAASRPRRKLGSLASELSQLGNTKYPSRCTANKKLTAPIIVDSIPSRLARTKPDPLVVTLYCCTLPRPVFAPHAGRVKNTGGSSMKTFSGLTLALLLLIFVLAQVGLDEPPEA